MRLSLGRGFRRNTSLSRNFSTLRTTGSSKNATAKPMMKGIMALTIVTMAPHTASRCSSAMANSMPVQTTTM